MELPKKVISISISLYIYTYMHSHVQLLATPWNVAYQAPLSMEFSRQKYWCGLPFLTPEDFPDPGSNPWLLWFMNWQMDPLPLSHLGSQSIYLQIDRYTQTYTYVWKMKETSCVETEDISFLTLFPWSWWSDHGWVLFQDGRKHHKSF